MIPCSCTRPEFTKVANRAVKTGVSPASSRTLDIDTSLKPGLNIFLKYKVLSLTILEINTIMYTKFTDGNYMNNNDGHTE